MSIETPAITVICALLVIVVGYFVTVRRHGEMTPDLIFKLVAFYVSALSFVSLVYGLINYAEELEKMRALWACLLIGAIANIYAFHQVYLKVFVKVE